MSDKQLENVDPVNHPKHYTSHPSGVECWQVTKHLPAELKDVIKYLWRTDLKNGLEDLEKALWYLQECNAITYLALLRNKDLYAENMVNAKIVFRYESSIGVNGVHYSNSPLGQALKTLIAGLEEDAEAFIYEIHELIKQINLELEGKN